MKKSYRCIASEHKGNEFLEECQEAGWLVTLVTRENLLDSPWAWTSLNRSQNRANDATAEDYIRVVTNLAGHQTIDRIVGLDEFDVLTAAKAREHLQIEGISNSYALRFRDKLRMRNLASEKGNSVPRIFRLVQSRIDQRIFTKCSRAVDRQTAHGSFRFRHQKMRNRRRCLECSDRSRQPQHLARSSVAISDRTIYRGQSFSR